jgi:hypothetical protein
LGFLRLQDLSELRFSVRWDGTHFGSGDVPFTQDDGFPFGNALKIAGEISLCLMNVNVNHDLLLV